MSLESTVGSGENILWKGKPDRRCYILEILINPLLAIAILFIAIYFLFLNPSEMSDKPVGELVVQSFMYFLPLLLYLFCVFTSTLAYRHEEYVVTDRAVYVSKGIFTVNYATKFFAEISRVNLHRGIIDQWLGVGDVLLTSSSDPNPSNSLKISDIPDYEDVFALIKKLQEDVYADVQYPNALRPEVNNGYQVHYGGELSKGRK